MNKANTDRILIRSDEVRLLEFNQQGQIARAKQRKLILLNDSVVCVSVSGRSSDVDFSPSSQERMNFKWSASFSELEVVDGPAQGTLARLTAGGSVTGKRSSLTRSMTPSSLPLYNSVESGQAENLAQEMADLMHDYDIMSRASTLLEGLKYEYPRMNSGVASDILNQIQASIRQKDEEMSYLDKCCLHLAIKKKDRSETVTFQLQSPKAKEDWIMELRLARLATDPFNSPAWKSEGGRVKSNTRMPLFVKNMVANSVDSIQSEVICGVSYTVMVQTPTRTMKPATYLWTACEEAAPAPIGGSGSKKTGTSAGGKETGATIIRVYRTERSQQIWIRELGCIRHPSALNAMLYVPRSPGLSNQYQDDRRSDQVWIAGTDKCITIYMAHDPEKGKELGQIILNSEPKVMMYSNAMVWVGLANGSINIYRRGLGGLWDTISPNVLLIGSEPISSIALAAAANPTPVIFATSGRRIAVIDQSAMDIERNINIGSTVAANENKSAANCDRLAAIATDIPADAKITHTATAGVGLWVALSNCSFVSLYHTESLQHIENVDLTPCVDMVMGLRDGGNVSTAAASVKRSITVTAMSASPAAGLLWIGTNVGLAITVPLPRLGGLPICSNSLSVSYHGMFGPIRMFLTMNHSVQSEEHVQAVQKKVYRMSTSSQVTIEEEPSKNSSSRLDQIEKTPLSARYSSPRTSSMRHSAGLPPHHPHHESVFRKSSDFSMDHSMRMEHSGNTSINSTPNHNSSNINSSCTVSASRRFSKTLPRGFSLSAATADCGSGVGDSVYGLYGDLLNVADYDSETGYGGQSVSGVNQTALANCHKSDPELNTIPYRVSTLDRRMTMKLARPRSLDLSSWSVESRSSSHTSSDGSDRSAPSPSVSRNASFMSHKSVGGASITMNGGGEISRNASMRKPGGAGSTTTNNVASASAAKQHKLEGARTVTTIMGGRGYHRWHPIKRLATNLAKMNDTDACLVAWEQKT